MSGLVRYPCPLTRGEEVIFAVLDLPSDLSMRDVQKIERMLEAIVVEQVKSVVDTSNAVEDLAITEQEPER